MLAVILVSDFWSAKDQQFRRLSKSSPILIISALMMMSWCLMSSDVNWHIRDKLWPMPKHSSIILYVHGNQKAQYISPHCDLEYSNPVFSQGSGVCWYTAISSLATKGWAPEDTMGSTHWWTDRQTHGHDHSSIPPNFIMGDITKAIFSQSVAMWPLDNTKWPSGLKHLYFAMLTDRKYWQTL